MSFVHDMVRYISVADPEIKEPGGAVPARYIFVGLEIVLIAISHISYAFVVRVDNNIHIVSLHVNYNKVYACYSVEIFKINP